MLPVPTFSVLAQPHPLRPERDAFFLGVGCTVEDAICEAAYRRNVPLALMAHTVVVIGDRVIAKEDWRSTRPHAGEQVAMRAVPDGPLVALIPVILSAAATSTAISAGLVTAGSFAAAAIGIGATLVGMAIQMALTPTPRQSSNFGGRADEVSPLRSLQGTRNDARPYQPIPRIFGRVVGYTPPRGTEFYTELSRGTSDQFLRVVFVLGEGPLSISALKIGDTPVANFEDVTVRIREGYSTDPDLTLFPAQVRETPIQIELKQANGYSQRRSEVSTDEMSIDVVFPNGLQLITGRGRKYQLQVSFHVQYKAATSDVWLNADISDDRVSVIKDGSGYFTIRANSKQAIRRTIRIEVPERGQYDLRIKRVTQDDQSDNEGQDQTVTTEQAFWTAFRSYRNDPPFNAANLATVEMRIRATDQLNGVIDQFNCSVQAVLPVWTGSAWVEQETRSPAWAFAEVLRGRSNARPLADSRLDLDALLAWDASSAALGLTFDGAFIDAGVSAWDRLTDIAATANAVPATPNGIYTVVVDEARPTVAQHFTARNLTDVRGEKSLVARPHALRVRWPDEQARGQWSERIIYRQGYNATTATRFEVLDLPYTTNARAAVMRARRLLWQAELRPEIYYGTADFEHLVCTPGDRVKVAHPTMLWAVGSARVHALATSGSNTTGITLDAPLTMDGAESYTIYCRLADGTDATIAVDTVAGDQTDLTFTTPVATATGPQVGDLVTLGEPVDLIVRNIDSQDHLSATISFLDYSPEIFDADAGPIDDWDPQITLPPVANRATPSPPSIESVDSGEGVLVRASDGTFVSRIVVSFTVDQSATGVAAEIVQARFRESGSVEDWQIGQAAAANGGTISLAPVEDEATYSIELRSVSAVGATSEWVRIDHTVVGKTSVPPDVERFYRSGDALVWPYPNPPVDLAGFILRANYGTSQDWGAARALHQGVVTAPPFDISALHGTQTILIKAVDTSGNVSATAASVTIDLGDLPVENVIDTQSEAPGFTGTITGGAVSGGVLEADLLSSPLFWRADDALFWPTNDSDDFWPSNVYDELTYVASWTPASDQLDDGILLVDTDITGDYTLDYRISTSPLFWGSGGSTFWGADDDLFWPESTIGSWVPWPGRLGPFDTTADTYQVRATVLGGPVQGVITELDLICDVPDIVERFDDVAIAATTGTRLTLTRTYRAIDNIVITRQDDGGTGVRAEWVDKQANAGAAGGPLIKVRDASSAVVDGVVDVVIKGH
jgi:hypothetical protein